MCDETRDDVGAHLHAMCCSFINGATTKALPRFARKSEDTVSASNFNVALPAWRFQGSCMSKHSFLEGSFFELSPPAEVPSCVALSIGARGEMLAILRATV